MLPVRAEVSTGAAQSPADNGSPDFEDDKDTRTVLESLAVHSAVGDPFRAIEPDPEDVLTYDLYPRRLFDGHADDDTEARRR